MTSDLDIYRSASVLVKHHGQDAPIRAAMRADAMLEKGDLDGYDVWKRILRAVEATGGGTQAGQGGVLIGRFLLGTGWATHTPARGPSLLSRFGGRRLKSQTS